MLNTRVNTVKNGERLKTLEVVRDLASLRAKVREWRSRDETIGLIPTMGALHNGHLALVQAALNTCDHAVTTIFVNPTQFAPNEDFEAYPRNEGEDLARLQALSVDLAFLPPVEEMYADGFSTSVNVSGLTEGLCGASRPHFFEGVATVVSKLLLQAMPDKAFFGEKDYQQLQVVTRMARDLNIPVEIVGVPTVREADGLAMSSRNWYLTPKERAAAPTLYKVLCEIADKLSAGSDSLGSTATGRMQLEAAGFRSVDYIEVCDACSLEPLEKADRPARVLAAVHLGRTRLIDNVPVGTPG